MEDVNIADREQEIEIARQEAQRDEDYRGFFMPKDLKNSVLFTRQQLRQLLNRKRELDEEIEGLAKEQKENRQLTQQY